MRQVATALLGTMLLSWYCMSQAAHVHGIGSFKAIDPATPTTGTFEITLTDSGRVLRFGDGFQVKPAPDLHVILSLLALNEANNTNATGSGVDLGLLKSPSGAQEYALPDSVALADYNSILIHCVEYSHLFGGGEIQPPSRTRETPDRTSGVRTRQFYPIGATDRTIDLSGRAVSRRSSAGTIRLGQGWTLIKVLRRGAP